MTRVNAGNQGRRSMARAARTVRGLWPDRNPLRRTLDRIEAAIAGGLAVAFLAGAPWQPGMWPTVRPRAPLMPSGPGTRPLRCCAPALLLWVTSTGRR